MSRTLARTFTNPLLRTNGSRGVNPLLRSLKATSPTGAQSIFDAIDKYTGAKGVRQFVSGLDNPSGYDLNKQLGLLTGNGLIDVPLGIATEMALDPTTYLTGGASGVGKAGRAARAANLLQDAPRVFSRAALNAGKADDLVNGRKLFGVFDSVGGRAKKTYDKLGIPINRLTDEDLAVRPLIGRREAMRNVLPGTNRPMNLGDLVNAAPDSKKALEDVSDFLRNKNVQETLNSPVYKDLALDIPLVGPAGGINLPSLGRPVSRSLDILGDAARYSGVGRRAASLADKSLLETVDDADQLIAKRLTNKEAIKNVDATKKMSALMRSVDSDLINMIRTNPDAGRYVKAAVEGNEKYLQSLYKNADQFKALKNHRQFDKLIQEIRKFNKGYLEESAQAGVKSASLQDPFGNQYFSRRLDRNLYPNASKGGVTVNEASVITGDMQQRSPEFNIPGGTAMLTDISRALANDPDLEEASKLTDFIMQKVKAAESILPTPKTVTTQVPMKIGRRNVFNPLTGKQVMQTVTKAPEYTKGQAKELANKLLGMDLDYLREGNYLFDENPFEALDRYASGRSKAIGRAEELQSMIAQTATRGGTGTPIKRALQNLGMQTTADVPYKMSVRNVGAEQNVVDSIQSLAGKGVITEPGELGKWRTNTNLQKRIQNVAKFYDDVKEQGELMKFIGGVTKNFKVWVLATPRRSVRDWYSGMFSNYITHPVVRDHWHGYSIAKRAIIEQDWDGARSLLEKIPRYQRIKAAGGDVVKAAQDDLAVVGILETGTLRDIDAAGELLEESPQVFDKYLGGSGKRQSTLGYQAWDALTGGSSKAGMGDVSVAKGINEFRANPKSVLSEATPFEKSLVGAAGDALSGEIPKVRKEYVNVKNPILRTAARTAEVSDKINRLGGFFGMMTGGYSPEAAAKAITEAQIDYSGLTRFERRWLQAIFPFWSYQSRIVKWGTKQMWNDSTFKNFGLRTPQRIGESLGEDDEVAPSRIAERYGIPFPDVMAYVPDAIKPYVEPLLGEAVPGVDVWLSDIDIAFVDSLNTIVPVMSPDESGVFGNQKLSLSKTAGKTAQAVAGSMLNPLAKFGVEQMSGQDLFTKQPLDATRRSAATIAQRALGATPSQQETIGTVEPLFTTTMPGLNHALSIGRKLSSPKGGEGIQGTARNALDSLLNMTTGMKIERIGEEERIRDIRQKIDNFISQSPVARSMSIPYIPKEDLENLDPDDILLQLMELDKQERNELKKVREDRIRGRGFSNPLLTP